AIADAATDADHLAMAAWVSPSGANRSAWLARARAAASGTAASPGPAGAKPAAADPRARAFVERRLVERHLEAGLADWAMATLRGARIDHAPDGEAALLEAQTYAALGGDALRLAAMRRLQTAAAAPDAPDAVLDMLGDLGASFDANVAAATRARQIERGDVGPSQVAGAQVRGRDAVVGAARRALAGGVTDADDAIAVVQTVARAGAHDEARAMFETLARWSPNRSGIWAGLAQETGAASGDAMRAEAIAAGLRRARELDPGEARYRAEIALRTRAPHAPTGDEPHDDEKYLVSSQTILARRLGPGRAPAASAPPAAAPGAPEAKSAPAAAPAPASAAADEAPDVADRELHWLRAVVMHPDRRVSEL